MIFVLNCDLESEREDQSIVAENGNAGEWAQK
jgi:hypothetical protein